MNRAAKPVEDLADIAHRVGLEMADNANDAFEAFCEDHDEPAPTKRERLLIKVLSLQLASAVATALEDRK